MTNIVHGIGFNLSDDVLKISDVLPVAHKPARPRARLIDDTYVLDDEDFTPAFSAEFAPEDEPEAADTLSPLQQEVLQTAMAEAGRILEDAVRKAEAEKQEKLAEVEFEAQELRQNATEEGRRQGMAAVVNDVKAAATGLEQAIATFEGQRAGFEAEYEQQLRWLAMEIASKVLAKKVADNDAEMLEMVEKAVQSVRNEAWIRVEVAQEMLHLIDRLTALFEDDDNISVSPIPAESGTVHVETPSGVVDVSLHTQLANLRDYFAQAAG